MANGNALAGLVAIAVTYKLMDETLKHTKKHRGLGLMRARR